MFKWLKADQAIDNVKLFRNLVGQVRGDKHAWSMDPWDDIAAEYAKQFPPLERLEKFNLLHDDDENDNIFYEIAKNTEELVKFIKYVPDSVIEEQIEIWNEEIDPTGDKAIYTPFIIKMILTNQFDACLSGKSDLYNDLVMIEKMRLNPRFNAKLKKLGINPNPDTWTMNAVQSIINIPRRELLGGITMFKWLKTAAGLTKGDIYTDNAGNKYTIEEVIPLGLSVIKMPASGSEAIPLDYTFNEWRTLKEKNGLSKGEAAAPADLGKDLITPEDIEEGLGEKASLYTKEDFENVGLEVVAFASSTSKTNKPNIDMYVKEIHAMFTRRGYNITDCDKLCEAVFKHVNKPSAQELYEAVNNNDFGTVKKMVGKAFAEKKETAWKFDTRGDESGKKVKAALPTKETFGETSEMSEAELAEESKKVQPLREISRKVLNSGPIKLIEAVIPATKEKSYIVDSGSKGQKSFKTEQEAKQYFDSVTASNVNSSGTGVLGHKWLREKDTSAYLWQNPIEYVIQALKNKGYKINKQSETTLTVIHPTEHKGEVMVHLLKDNVVEISYDGNVMKTVSHDFDKIVDAVNSVFDSINE